MKNPVYRYLRGYSLDPGYSTKLDTVEVNEALYRIPFENLEPGPVGEYVEVMDFDPASRCWYEPVDLNDVRVASQHGLAPSEGNPQFHQQFVYAVAMKTIRHFEQALGRKILWYPRKRRVKGNYHETYIGKLRIHPHALREANAYYDPDKKALLFGYFTAAAQSQGANYPGGLVFTCLSPDIVAHETTHAILDSIHHRYMEDTNLDVAAFHEGFSDIVALLQRFTFASLVEHQIEVTSGDLTRFSVLGELATQFGEAIAGHRGALRSMIGRRDEHGRWKPLQPSPSDYWENVEAHDRGAVLVATVFDAFQRLYKARTSDLLRIATAGTGVLPEGRIGRDLVRRLAKEASVIAEHLLHICIRALDYCPPIDITFGSYLRALITADLDIAPEDESGFRVALIEAFRARGIFPSRVKTLSVESLCWERPRFTPMEQKAVKWIALEMKEGIRKLVETTDREELHRASNSAKAKLHVLLENKQRVLGPIAWERFLNKLGLTSLSTDKIFGPHSKDVEFVDSRGRARANGVPLIEVHTLRPAFRAGREGRQLEQVVVTLTQRVRASVGSDEKRVMTFRGGCTLILTFGNLNEVEYVVLKSIRNYKRFQKQASYFSGEGEAEPPGLRSVYADGRREWRLSFNLLHRH